MVTQKATKATQAKMTLANTAVVLLPSESNKIIFQYEPIFRVTAVIPSKQRKVKATRSPYDTHLKEWTEETQITVPTTLVSCNLDYYYHPNKERDFKALNAHTFSVWAVDDAVQDEIRTANYTLGNIHPGGNICFGTVVPKNLRQANNLFWEIPFTDHMWHDRQRECKCKAKVHMQTVHTKHHIFNKHKPAHSCNCSKEIYHNHSCLGYNNTVKNCEAITSKIKIINKNLDAKKLSVTEAADQLVDFLKKKRSPAATKENIENCICCKSLLQKEQTCKCLPRHKATCLCGRGITGGTICRCPCECDCCTDKCNCKCECYCCRGTCACPCDCKRVKFLEYIKNYDFQKQLKWSNATTTICGTKFFAKPTTAAGLLLSQDKQILDLVPKKYWKKYSFSKPKLNTAVVKTAKNTKDNKDEIKEEKEFVIALGNPKNTGEVWEFVIGDFKFELSASQVSFK